MLMQQQNQLNRQTMYCLALIRSYEETFEFQGTGEIPPKAQSLEDLLAKQPSAGAETDKQVYLSMIEHIKCGRV